MAKEIKLTKGFVAIVDDEDYEWLSQWKWHYDKYACRRKSTGYKQSKIVFMHREILGYEGELDVDHINKDRIDNRKCNLRLATRSQNLANTMKKSLNFLTK